jgi:hypothetical protein
VSKTIYRYDIPVKDTSVVRMPAGALPLSVGPSRDGNWGEVSLWAEVDNEAPEIDTKFFVRGAGHELGEVGPFLGTVNYGPLVWHIYRGLAR